MIGFITVSVGLTMLAFTIRSEWGCPFVIFSLILTGLGEGAANVVVQRDGLSLAKRVGRGCGCAARRCQQPFDRFRTAFAGLAAVGLLALFVTSSLFQSDIPDSLKTQVNLDNINFITNEQLETVLSETTATPAEVMEAVRINEDARLRALKASFS